MIKTISLLVPLIIGVISGSAQAIKNQDWLDDFTQLKREMTSHYANLEWAVSERGLNLKQLSDETEAKLRSANTEIEAKAAIDTFVRSFGDGHLTVQWSAPATTAAAVSSQKLCDRMGYRARPMRAGIDLTPLANFRSIESSASKVIPAGTMKLQDGKTVGIVGIKLFSEEIFPELCETAVAEMKIGDEADCDDRCQAAIRKRTADLYIEAMGKQVELVKKDKVDLLLVDLTGNGGGSDIYQPMARMLTDKPLRSPAAGFVRHQHWIKQNQDRLNDIEAEIPRSTGKMQDLLKAAADGLRRDLEEAKKPCDTSQLWNNQKPDCSRVVAFAKGPVPYAKSGEFSNTALGSIFFPASRYKYTEGLYNGKLAVLVDQRTASSSEAFASMLRDNNAAVIIGAPTVGAGCGYPNGGIPTTLTNSGARVRMPDCVRFRADGSNEINGITPDVIIPWRTNDSPYQRARRLVESLRSL